MDSPEELLASIASIVELVPDYEWRTVKVLATSDTVFASVLELAADSVAGGGPVALRFGLVVTVAAGRLTATELFDPDDEAAILARFEELRSAAESPVERMVAESRAASTRRTGRGCASFAIRPSRWSTTARREPASSTSTN